MKMKSLTAMFAALTIAQAFVGAPSADAGTASSGDAVHRYLVASTTSDDRSNLGTVESSRAKANDLSAGAHWLRSYASADRSRVFSLYEAPTEAAVRKAASLNRVPIDSVVEVPVVLDSESGSGDPTPGDHRFLIERTFPAGALDGLDSATKAQVNTTNSKFGVQWVTSYANGDKTKTYCIYNATDEAAVRAAAKANGLPVDKVTEVPNTAAAK
jgi:hypothetical protein